MYKKFDRIPQTPCGKEIVKKVAAVWGEKGNITPDQALAIVNKTFSKEEVSCKAIRSPRLKTK